MNAMNSSSVAQDIDLSDDQVARYLRENPNFFSQCPELLQNLTPPKRWTGDTVVDLQHYMVSSLKDELAGLRDCAQSVIETSRVNLATQMRTHAAVLSLIATNSLEHLVRVISGDLPIYLDVDVTTIGLEIDGGIVDTEDEVRPLPYGSVAPFFGDDRDIILFPKFTDDGTVFGAGSGLVRSAAFARLHATDEIPDGVLALGARTENAFHPRQGTELLRFVAQVIELCLKRVYPSRS